MATFRVGLIASVVCILLPMHLSLSQPSIDESEIPDGIDPTVRQHILKLYSRDAGERATSARMLGRSGKRGIPAIPFLADMIGETGVVVERQQAIPSHDNVTTIQSGDKVFKVGELAAEALGNLGLPSLGPLLIALRDGRKWERSHAALGLGKIRDSTAVIALIEATQDDEFQVKLNAVVSLGYHDEGRVVDQLLFMTKDEEIKMRAAAVEALGWQSDPRVNDLLETVRQDAVREVLLEYARATNRRFWARQPLSSAAVVLDKQEKWRMADVLHGEYWSNKSGLQDSVHQVVSHALMASQDSLAIRVLLCLLSDTLMSLQSQAAHCLGRLESREAVEHLIAALHSRNDVIRREAVWSLGIIRDRRAEASLRSALTDSSGSVLTAVAWALAELNVPDKGTIVSSVLTKLYSDIADSATMTSMRQNPRVLPFLTSIAKLYKVQVAALRGESSSEIRTGPDGSPVLRLNLLALDPDEIVAPYARAVESLGHVADRTATECLVDLLGEFEGVRLYAPLYKHARHVEDALMSMTDDRVTFGYDVDVTKWRRWLDFAKRMQARTEDTKR